MERKRLCTAFLGFDYRCVTDMGIDFPETPPEYPHPLWHSFLWDQGWKYAHVVDRRSKSSSIHLGDTRRPVAQMADQHLQKRAVADPSVALIIEKIR